MFRQVLTMMTAIYTDKQLYAISTLLKTASWGRKSDYENQERILCDAKDNKPYFVWIVGWVSFAWFVKRGNYAEKPSITIIPVNSNDANTTVETLTKLAKPAKHEHTIIYVIDDNSPQHLKHPFTTIHEPSKQVPMQLQV